MRARPLCSAIPRNLESSLSAAGSPTPRPDPRLQRWPRRPLPARPALGTRRCPLGGSQRGDARGRGAVRAPGESIRPGTGPAQDQRAAGGPTPHCVKGQRSSWPLGSGMLPEGGWGAGSGRVPTSFQEETGPVKGGEEGLEVRSGVSCRRWTGALTLEVTGCRGSAWPSLRGQHRRPELAFGTLETALAGSLLLLLMGSSMLGGSARCPLPGDAPQRFSPSSDGALLCHYSLSGPRPVPRAGRLLSCRQSHGPLPRPH